MTTNKPSEATGALLTPSNQKGDPQDQPSPKARQKRTLLVLGHFCPPTQAQMQIIAEAFEAGESVTVGVEPGPDGLKYTEARRNIAREFQTEYYVGKISFCHLPKITDVYQGPGSRIRTRRPT